jgi:hypothetical protein
LIVAVVDRFFPQFIGEEIVVKDFVPNEVTFVTPRAGLIERGAAGITIVASVARSEQSI